MASVNQATLVGYLGKDPDVKAFQDGRRYATFSLATDEGYTDKRTGEKIDRAEWHFVVVTNESLVGVVEKFARKGSRLYVQGKLRTRKFTDKSGVERYVTEVILGPYGSTLVLLGEGKGGARDAGQPAASAPAANSADAGIGDDDIPF